jgi:hypothetical protein
VDIDNLKEQLLSDPDVRRRVARRAYEIYVERRDYRHAHPHEDWLRAESEILPRLIQEIVERNERAIAANDDSDPVAHRAAEHMQEEIDLASSGLGERTSDAKAAGREMLDRNAEALAASAEGEDETVPNASGVLEGKPVKPAAKPAPKKAAAKKAPAKKAAAKPAAKKPAAKKPAAKKAPAKPKKNG